MTRGRVSGAAIEIAQLAQIDRIQRPDAPYDLSDEEAEEWRAVVGRMPADWFPRETHAMLTQYCRHVVRSRRVSQMIIALEDEITKEAKKGENKIVALLKATKSMDRLLKMQEREGRALSGLATRMRISQQASYDAKKSKAARDGAAKKTWEF